MNNPTVLHVLRIYQARMKMQQEGITNPSQEIKDMTRTIVEELSEMPPDEKIIFDDYMMKDSKGNVIIKFPKDKAIDM